MRLSHIGLGVLLYAVLALGAIPASAGDLTADDRAALKEMRAGHMAKLVFHREARPAITESFRDKYGNEVTLQDYQGKVVLLNFWATWCPPCRAEMPGIDRLAGHFADDENIEVLTLSTDRFDVKRIEAFFDEIDVQNLRVLQDRRGAVARKGGVLGLPVTILLDREGREVARLQGEAEWDAPEAKAILKRLAEMTATQS
ncbi:MAG: TlpA disulfide reductase family protein [Pseudomonadota bacterium]